jgi:hypothetical protein
MGLPSSALAGYVVRAWTESPGLLFRESTGFVSTAFTGESPASVARLSPPWAAAEDFTLPCLAARAIGADGALSRRLSRSTRLALGRWGLRRETLGRCRFNRGCDRNDPEHGGDVLLSHGS